MYKFLLPFLIIILFSCNNEPPSSTSETPSPQVSLPSSTSTPLPSISDEFMTTLVMQTDFIDYIFYEHPISMSFDNTSAIRRVLSHLEKKPLDVSACKATGVAFFQKEGEKIAEAEFFMTDNQCRAFVFKEGGKAAYSNRISDKGMAFYQHSLQQAIDQVQK